MGSIFKNNFDGVHFSVKNKLSQVFPKDFPKLNLPVLFV